MKHFRLTSPAPRLSDVIYNAANQSFEATVTLFESGSPVKYACTFPAPINMSFRDATRRLIAQARKHQKAAIGLRATLAPPLQNVTARAPRSATTIWQNWSHSGFLRRRVA